MKWWLTLALASLALLLALLIPGKSDEPVRAAAPDRARPAAPLEHRSPIALDVGASAPVPAASPVPPGHLDVCGWGIVAAPERPTSDALMGMRPMPKPDWALQWEAEAEDLRAQAIAVLQVRGDELSRVLARLLQNDANAAAAVALRSTDPRAYGLAWQACHSRNAGAACEQLSLRRWVQLEPNNAWPWLGLLDEARRRGDASGVEEALHRAARAQRSDGGFGRFVGSVDEVLPADAPVGGRTELQVELIGRSAAFVIGWQVALLSVCSAEAARDANRRQNCMAIARVLAGQGRDLIDVGMGARLGRADR